MQYTITGANGQLGSEFKALAATYPQHEFLFTDVADLDITDAQAIEGYFKQHNTDVLINCAAYTAVDKAEEEMDKAMLINATAPTLLAKTCADNHTKFIHVSTDYVFDGNAYVPYTESDPTSPCSAYGKTKLAGEQGILNTAAQGFIVRTAWLYSTFGGNFVKTMLRLGSDRDKLSVVFDQIGCPTYARDLAKAILIAAEKNTATMEVLHYSNEGVCSWYDMAHEIMRYKNLHCKVSPIESKDYPTPATRPAYSVFNKSKIKNLLDIEIPHWRNSLTECLDNL